MPWTGAALPITNERYAMGKHINGRGIPKQSYLNYALANMAAKRVTLSTGVKKKPYICPICDRYHIGGKSQKILDKQRSRREENRVGILIGALKAVLNKEVE